ncbi:MAG: hypothetical protein ACFFCS_10895 [Candidatus Hodarchaeota archaeon]
MPEKSDKTKDISRFQSFHEKYKDHSRWLVRIGLIINILYVLVDVLMVTLYQFQGDMARSYFIAVSDFLEDPANTYSNLLCPFKNLPSILLYFMPLYYLELVHQNLGIYCSLVIEFSINLLTIHVLRKIVKLKEFKGVKSEFIFNILIFLFLVTPYQLMDYLWNQTNLFVNLFLVLSIFYFLQDKKQHLGFFWLSFSLQFKLTPLFLLPIVLLRKFKFRAFLGRIMGKPSAALNPIQAMKNLVFLAIPLLPSAIMFLVFPSMVEPFITINLYAPQVINTGFVTFLLIGIGSVTKLITVAFGVKITVSLLICAPACYLACAWYIVKNKSDIIETSFLGLFTVFLFVPDFIKIHNMFIWGYFILLALSQRVKIKFLAWFMVVLFTVHSVIFYVLTYFWYLLQPKKTNEGMLLNYEFLKNEKRG